MPTEDVTLPPVDRCAHGDRGWRCGRTESEHAVRWMDGGPDHAFVAPEGAPRPEHVVPCHIQTEWTCSHCGADNDVWGAAADEWMECSRCGGQSYLFPFMTPQPNDPSSGGTDG